MTSYHRVDRVIRLSNTNVAVESNYNLIFTSILLESNFIILIGAFLGLLFTIMTVPLIDVASGGLTGGIFKFETYQFIRGILIGILMASLAGIWPAYQAYRLKVVDALAKG